MPRRPGSGPVRPDDDQGTLQPPRRSLTAASTCGSRPTATEGYDAAVWLDGKRLDNRAISGSTVTGSIPASMLTKAGTHAPEIRIGEDGTAMSSTKVDFTIE